MTISPEGWRRHALLTPQQMGEADRLTIAGGVAGSALMENAGRGVADAVSRRWPVGPLVVLCGPGNNGGDGFVAARVLAERGWPVRVALLGSVAALRGDAAQAAARWCRTVEPLTPAALDGAALAVDGIFGAGLTRPVEGEARAVIEALDERRLPVVAIDVPSGVDGASGEVRGAAPRAAAPVTFFRKKPGHLLLPGRSHGGEIILVQIGIPETVLDRVMPDTAANDPLWWRAGLPRPSLESHKYTRGHALVAGGAVMTGAARLAAKSALRTGAGLVTLAAPEAAFPIYAAGLTGVIVHSIAGLDDFRALLVDKRRNAVLIGPTGPDRPRTYRNAIVLGVPSRDGLDTVPSLPSRPSMRMSSIVMIIGQHGHRAPERLIVPVPRRLSCSRRCAALPPITGTSVSTPKTTPVCSAFGVIVSSTRLLSFFASQRVFNSGIVARQPLQRTVRAQR
jgi:hydroxyethylthiazole kinase-like uncharacterized protein yjeF